MQNHRGEGVREREPPSRARVPAQPGPCSAPSYVTLGPHKLAASEAPGPWSASQALNPAWHQIGPPGTARAASAPLLDEERKNVLGVTYTVQMGKLSLEQPHHFLRVLQYVWELGLETLLKHWLSL